VETSFIGEGNRNTRRKPPICLVTEKLYHIMLHRDQDIFLQKYQKEIKTNSDNITEKRLGRTSTTILKRDQDELQQQFRKETRTNSNNNTGKRPGHIPTTIPERDQDKLRQHY
jgi:hypothetical protein